jgi:hypothetical protein
MNPDTHRQARTTRGCGLRGPDMSCGLAGPDAAVMFGMVRADVLDGYTRIGRVVRR